MRLGDGGRVRLVQVVLELGLVHDVHVVGAPLDQLLRQRLHAGAEENGRQLAPCGRRARAPCRAARRTRRDVPVALLREDPDAAVPVERQDLPVLLADEDRLERADGDARAAEGAVVLDDGEAVAHLDRVVEARADAVLAAGAPVDKDLDAAHAQPPRTMGTSSAASSATTSSTLPSMTRPPGLGSGAKILMTLVGEPSSPSSAASASRSVGATPDLGLPGAHLPLERGKPRLVDLLDDGEHGRQPDPTTSVPSSIIRSTAAVPSGATSIFRTCVTCGTSRCSATPGPTWAVSPSIACLPQRMRSNWPIFPMPVASV